MSLCELCDSLDVHDLFSFDLSVTPLTWRQVPHHRTYRDLEASARRCALCAVFFDGVRRDETEWGGIEEPPPGRPALWIMGNRQPNDDRHAPLGWEELARDPQKPRLLYGLTYTCYGRETRLCLYAEEGSPAAASGHVIARPVRAAEEVETAARWIQECITNHPQCRLSTEAAASAGNQAALPARVMDVGPADGSREPRVVCSSDGAVGAYVCLSHCWGEPGPGSAMVRTTTATIAAHMQRIPWASLPKTFRDAVAITRKLGVRFLWIDSLCIVQDDRADWERESAAMAGVYARALVTVAAAAASDSRTGCLLPRPQRAVVRLAYRYNGARPGGHVFLTAFPAPFEDAVNGGPLGRRAWVCQERFLSRRILHYAEEQLHWECQQACESESHVPIFVTARVKSNSRLGRQHPPSPSPSPSHGDACYWDWYDMIREYSRRQLSHGADKLPALSGLASHFAAQTGDRYAAGLWERHLPYGLLWNAARTDRARLRAPARPRAPSWSWAALDGHIGFHLASAFEPDARVVVDGVEVDVRAAGADPRGELAATGSTLTLHGRLAVVDTEVTSEDPVPEPAAAAAAAEDQRTGALAMLPAPRSLNDPLFYEGERVGHALFDQTGVESGPVHCLPVLFQLRYNRSYQEHHVLLLAQTGNKDEYRRIGAGKVEFPVGLVGSEDWFRHVPKTRITIV